MPGNLLSGWPVPGPRARWLAIGRVSPNKAIESTIAALAVTHAQGNVGATLRIIGKPATDSYVDALHRYVAELGLAHAVQFGGHASDATVVAAYAEADVLVVTSEHEGFCVPVVEAMSAGLPVVAFDQGAVPEVLGGSGVLVSDKDPYALAAAIVGLLGDEPRRDASIEAGRRRLAELDLHSAANRFVDLLVPLPRPGPAGRDCRAPVRPDAAPRRRGGAAHAAAARRVASSAASGHTSTWRWTIPKPLSRRARSPGTQTMQKPGTCSSTSSPRRQPSRRGWALVPKRWSSTTTT